MAMPERWFGPDSRKQQLADAGLDAAAIAKQLREILAGSEHTPVAGYDPDKRAASPETKLKGVVVPSSEARTGPAAPKDGAPKQKPARQN